jgi:ABC-type branched-subunit amino acid transport system substrate-binding protein
MRSNVKEIVREQSGFARMGNKIAVIIIAVAVAALALFFMLRVGEKETVTIGAILAISGAGGYVGEEIRDGMLLAVDEINSWGGINGRKIELIVEDSKTTPQIGKEMFNKIEKATVLFCISQL